MNYVFITVRKMLKILLYFGIFVLISDRKWSILQRFDNDYLEEMVNYDKCELIIALFRQDLGKMFQGIDRTDHNAISKDDVLNDIVFFLGRGLNFQENIQVIVDMYVKHLAMWAMLIFKVGSLLKANENQQKIDMVDDCDTVSFYMGSFYFQNFERINFQLKLVREEFEGMSDEVDTDERKVTEFTANSISEKMRYIHAVSNKIYFTFAPAQFSNYGPSLPLTHYFFTVTNELDIKPTDIFNAVQGKEEATSVFQGDCYEAIWLKLLNNYDRELIDVENYFSSLLGENRRITSLQELIPPKSEVESIWQEASTFVEYLRNPALKENERNKGGRILMQMEKIKEIQRGKLSHIGIYNLLLHKTKEGTSDFKVKLELNNTYGLRIRLEQVMSAIFPN